MTIKHGAEIPDAGTPPVLAVGPPRRVEAFRARNGPVGTGEGIVELQEAGVPGDIHVEAVAPVSAQTISSPASSQPKDWGFDRPNGAVSVSGTGGRGGCGGGGSSGGHYALEGTDIAFGDRVPVPVLGARDAALVGTGGAGRGDRVNSQAAGNEGRCCP